MRNTKIKATEKFFLPFLFVASAGAAAPVEVAKLNSEHPQTVVNFSVEREGETELTIKASAPGTDWGEIDAESAVLTLYLDGEYNQDIVLFAGEQIFEYDVMLEFLAAGEHQLKFVFNQEKSREETEEIVIHNYSILVHTPDNPDYDIYHYAPIFYGRDDNTYTDVPLLMWHEKKERKGGSVHLRYGVIWSNEDGGTHIIDLLGIYGRPTDIEWIYEIILDTANKIVGEKYHGVGHQHTDFKGKKFGGHPVLKLASKNNNMSDEGESSLLFRFCPRPTIPEEFIDEIAESCLREMLMNENPWIYKIAFKEIQREGKIEEEADWQTKKVSDLRNYVSIDYKTEVPPQAREFFNGYYISRDVELQFGVKFKEDEQWYTADHNSQARRPSKESWARTAIEVPEGYRPENVENMKVKIYPKGHLEYYQITLLNISSIFMLDEHYLPGKSIFSWAGEAILNQDNPEIIFNIE